MKTEHDWRDVLLKAASIVEQGWCQGALHLNKEGDVIYNREEADRSCATGAIARASDQLSGEREPVAASVAAYDLGEDARRGLRKHLGISIPIWNDHWDRTADEVAESMRQAATT